MNNPSAHTNTRFLKATLWAFALAVLFLAAVRLSLKTTFVQDFAKNKIEEIARQNLNTHLSIETLKGDLWKEVQLINTLVSNPDTLISFDTLKIEYDLLSYFFGVFEIEKLLVQNASVFAEENPTDKNSAPTFNIQEVVKPGTSSQKSGFRFSINEIQVSGSKIKISSPTFLPDTSLAINNVTLTAGLLFADEVEASLSNLSFLLQEGRLPEPIQIKTSGGYENSTISLQQLMVSTGQSILEANGFFDTKDSLVNAHTKLTPLSSLDINAYLSQDIPPEEFTVSLKAGGSVDSLELELNLDGIFIDELVAVANLDLSGTPTLTRFGVTGNNLNLAALTNNSLDIQTGLFHATMDGILTSNYKKADITWGFTIEGIRYEDYNLRRFFGSGTYIEGEVLANLDATTLRDERLTTNSQIRNIFSDTTSWDIGFVLQDFNAAHWADEAPKSNLSLRGSVNGSGFKLSEKPWAFRISNSPIQYNHQNQLKNYNFYKRIGLVHHIAIEKQPLKLFRLKGTINKDSVLADGFAQIKNSNLNFQASIANYNSERPSYDFVLSSDDFNINELDMVEDFPTSIGFEVYGKGSGSNLATLEADGFAKMDSSFINGAELKKLNAAFEIKKGILQIHDAELISDIASGSFSGRKNILNKKDPENVLSLNLEIKNTQPFAPLVNLETLQGTGIANVDIKESEQGFLQCVAEFDLDNIIVDDLFLANKISGTVNVDFKEQEEGRFELTISKPQIQGTTLQDVHFATESTRSEDSVSGTYSMDIQGNEAGQILSSGNYSLNTENTDASLSIKQLDLTANNERLSLLHDFNISFIDKSIQTDSLELTSTNGAFLSLSIPYADSVKQKARLNGENFEFGTLQEIILNERIIDGVLSGQLYIDRDADNLKGAGNLVLENIEFEGLQADIFTLDFDIKNERLTSNADINWGGKQIVSGNLDVPFNIGDPKKFPNTFFEEPVSGQLEIFPTTMERLQPLLNRFEITKTEGIVSFKSTLSGTAAQPNFDGKLHIQQPVLSNIPLDSVLATFTYNHTKELVSIKTEVLTASQKAADIELEVPFSYNFKTFEVNTVDENSPILANIKTENFNLSVFNDFLNKDYTQKLNGVLNGELSVTRTKNNLNAQGYLDLTESSLTVPVAGITLDDIQSRLEFRGEEIQVSNLKMNSGKGTFKANGSIQLAGLYPETVNINASANQFKLANTNEYNVVVDLNSKLSGHAYSPTASGKLAIKNGFIVLDNFGDKVIEDVQLEGEKAPSYSFYDSLNIDMELSIDKNFFVRNRRYLDMEVEITGSLDAQKKSKDDLFLFGTLEGISGYLRPLGKHFDLEEANMAFSGPADNPELNVRSAYNPSLRKGTEEITLHYIVKGTAKNPEFSFESTPQMEQQDIVCYTLFNRPCYVLDPWQNAFTNQGGASPTDLFTGALLDEVEALATRRLGVDVVQIDNTRVGNETGTSVKTGWYLNEKTFFAILNEITSSDPKTLFILEYALSKNLDLILTEGEDSNRRGIDLRWQFDY